MIPESNHLTHTDTDALFFGNDVIVPNLLTLAYEEHKKTYTILISYSSGDPLGKLSKLQVNQKRYDRAMKDLFNFFKSTLL